MGAADCHLPAEPPMLPGQSCGRSLERALGRLIGRFLGSSDGGTAPFLALSLIPLMGFTGAAVDYARANSVKVAMQAALDSTGLILSKTANTMAGGGGGSGPQ